MIAFIRWSMLILFAASLAFLGCAKNEGAAEEAGEATEEAAEEAGEAMEEAGEEAGEAMDEADEAAEDSENMDGGMDEGGDDY